jgi:hypothetical protein
MPGMDKPDLDNLVNFSSLKDVVSKLFEHMALQEATIEGQSQKIAELEKLVLVVPDIISDVDKLGKEVKANDEKADARHSKSTDRISEMEHSNEQLQVRLSTRMNAVEETVTGQQENVLAVKSEMKSLTKSVEELQKKPLPPEIGQNSQNISQLLERATQQDQIMSEVQESMGKLDIDSICRKEELRKATDQLAGKVKGAEDLINANLMEIKLLNASSNKRMMEIEKVIDEYSSTIQDLNQRLVFLKKLEEDVSRARVDMHNELQAFRDETAGREQEINDQFSTLTSTATENGTEIENVKVYMDEVKQDLSQMSDILRTMTHMTAGQERTEDMIDDATHKLQSALQEHADKVHAILQSKADIALVSNVQDALKKLENERATSARTRTSRTSQRTSSRHLDDEPPRHETPNRVMQQRRVQSAHPSGSGSRNVGAMDVSLLEVQESAAPPVLPDGTSSEGDAGATSMDHADLLEEATSHHPSEQDNEAMSDGSEGDSSEWEPSPAGKEVQQLARALLEQKNRLAFHERDLNRLRSVILGKADKDEVRVVASSLLARLKKKQSELIQEGAATRIKLKCLVCDRDATNQDYDETDFQSTHFEGFYYQKFTGGMSRMHLAPNIAYRRATIKEDLQRVNDSRQSPIGRSHSAANDRLPVSPLVPRAQVPLNSPKGHSHSPGAKSPSKGMGLRGSPATKTSSSSTTVQRSHPHSPTGYFFRR